MLTVQNAFTISSFSIFHYTERKFSELSVFKSQMGTEGKMSAPSAGVI